MMAREQLAVDRWPLAVGMWHGMWQVRTAQRDTGRQAHNADSKVAPAMAYGRCTRGHWTLCRQVG